MRLAQTDGNVRHSLAFSRGSNLLPRNHKVTSRFARCMIKRSSSILCRLIGNQLSILIYTNVCRELSRVATVVILKVVIFTVFGKDNRHSLQLVVLHTLARFKYVCRRKVNVCIINVVFRVKIILYQFRKMYFIQINCTFRKFFFVDW